MLVDEPQVDDRLHGREHALERALARISDGVNDVGLKHQVAVARVIRHVDRVARARVDEAVQPLREGLVDVDQHRVLLLRIEVLRLDQHPGERDTVQALVAH